MQGLKGGTSKKVKKINRDFFMEAFFCAIWVALLYALFAMPAILNYGVQSGVFFLLVVVIFFSMFLIRRFIKSAVLMFLAHLLIPLVVGLFSIRMPYIVLYLGMTVVMMLFSLYQRHERTMTFTPEFAIFAPIIVVVLAIALGFQGHAYMYTTYAAIVIVVGAGSRLHLRMTKLGQNLDHLTQGAEPVKKILKFDYKAMLVLGTVLVVMILLVHIVLVRPAVEGLADLLPQELTFDMDSGYIDIYAFTQNIYFDSVGFFPWDDSGPFFMWVVVEWLALYIVMPIIRLGIAVVILLAIFRIYRAWNKRKWQPSVARGGYTDEKEFITDHSWVTQLLRMTTRNEHKLRRRFREAVLQEIKKGVPIVSSDTPSQMANKILSDDFTALAEEYAQVRYRDS